MNKNIFATVFCVYFRLTRIIFDFKRIIFAFAGFLVNGYELFYLKFI